MRSAELRLPKCRHCLRDLRRSAGLPAQSRGSRRARDQLALASLLDVPLDSPATARLRVGVERRHHQHSGRDAPAIAINFQRRGQMRIAVISDIHGNCLALDAVLADLQRDGVDWIVCLGDAIQGGAQPAETVARLRDLGCPIVMGNADAWLLTGEETGAEGPPSEQLLA